MGRELQKKKNRSSLPKIRQRRQSKAAMRNPRGNPVIAANWDNSATLSQNYMRLGLVSKLNHRAGGVEKSSANAPRIGDDLLLRSQAGKQRKALEVRVERDPATGAILQVLGGSEGQSTPLDDPLRDLDSESDGDNLSDLPELPAHAAGVIREMKDQAANPAPKRPRQQSKREQEWVSKLVDRYGDDFRRMAQDHKLNPQQQTEADLRRRVNTWKQSREVERQL